MVEASFCPLPEAQVHRPAAGPGGELHIYNTDCGYQGRLTRGLTPEEALSEVGLWL